MPRPSPIYLYRIIYIENLNYILKLKKITAPTHNNADSNYEGIGDTTLKTVRSNRQIELDPGGRFCDYIAFYFGARSPMLYNIHHGFMGVPKRQQEEIVYLISTYETVNKLNLPYVYFDGHGYHNFSRIFNSEDGLDELDWNTIDSRSWFDTEDDPDRKRRKQAEFLVHSEMPIESIHAVGVFNQNSKERVKTILLTYGVQLEVIVFRGGYY